jgi:hypothetical protein
VPVARTRPYGQVVDEPGEALDGLVIFVFGN